MASYTLSPIGGAGSQFFDNSGNVLSGGKLYTYKAGTTTPTPTYTNPAGTTANSNPVVFNSAGRPANEIWLSAEYVYKFVLKDANDVLIATYDNIPGLPQPPIVNDASSISYEPNIIVSAGSFVVGQTYMIASLGDTDFVSIGAVYNSTGVIFTATGAGSGTGTAYVSTTVETRLRAYEASSGSNYIGFLQSGTGAVSTTVQTKLRETVNVKDFGAVGDGVTDDTAAIQTAIDSAVAHGQQITAYGTFKITSKIVIKGDTDFSQATFNVYGTPAVALEISTGNATDPTTEISRCVIWTPKRLNNMTKPATGWAGQGVGLRVVSAFDCQIFVGGVKGFATGLLCTSFNTNGNVHNNYYLGFLQNNKVNLALTPGDSTSWVNENNFIGGHLSHESAEGTNVSGVRQILISKATFSVNNNLFIKPSLEGDTPEYHVENGGVANTIQQARWEASPPKVLYSSNNTNQGVDNVIFGGYQVNSIVFTMGSTTANYNKVIGGRSNNYDSGTSTTGIYKYMNGGSSSDPIHTFYEASSSTGRPEVAGATEWAVRHSAQNLQGKRRADAYARVNIDYANNEILLGNGAADPVAGIYASTSNLALKTPTGAAVRPDWDNTVSSGLSSYRWSVIYAGTGTINTSDENEKTNIRPLDYKEKAVALAIKARIKAFKFKDAVEQKGDDARIHFGVIAQDVKAAFEAEGLDATKYGVFCSDTLEDGTERLGIRYDELLVFIMGAI